MHHSYQIILTVLTLFPLLATSQPAISYSTQSIEGWTVHLDASLVNDSTGLGGKVLSLIRSQLFSINHAFPDNALEFFHHVPIWVDVEEKDFPGCVYHPSADWLREHGYDPQKAKAVQIGNARHFYEWSLDQPAMILHEMAHAYHDQVLSYDNPEIKKAYQNARESKKYESVLYCRGGMQRAYALNNDQEYFAELTEAFFSTNDFYPFVRAEVETFDPEMYALLKKVWGVKN